VQQVDGLGQHLLDTKYWLALFFWSASADVHDRPRQPAVPSSIAAGAGNFKAKVRSITTVW
jgi:hypothetical protein